MPSAVSPNPRAAPEPADDLDDLFNYDAGIDAVFNDADGTHNTVQTDSRVAAEPIRDIDEEIKITRKRQPIAKLDEPRLLSQNGIPKLRKIAKNLRFKGKGHEFSDMARLLNTYQLWLDDLYPRAKFADGLEIIEKLGHTKRMQIMRKEWINEGKPKPDESDVEEDDTQDHVTGVGAGEISTESGDSTRAGIIQQDEGRSDLHSEPHDEMDAPGPQPQPEEPDEDELDALLAEEPQTNDEPYSLFGSGSAPNKPAPAPVRDEFADEEEAMAGMDW